MAETTNVGTEDVVGARKATLQTEVKITPAKGRPMLTWVGKRPLSRVTAFPAQLVETHSISGLPGRQKTEGWPDWPPDFPKGGLLFHGDNKDVLAHLLAEGLRGKVRLVYIDPPFDSGADYVRKVLLRGIKGTAKMDGEGYSLGEQVQYSDIWANDNYLQFMFERLLLVKELLAEGGSLFLHCDWKRTHLLRCILDEVFGPDMFRNEIIRVKCNPKNSKRKAYGNTHDCVLFYVKGESDGRPWTPQRETVDSEDLERIFEKVDASGRRYTTVALHAQGERRGETGQPWKGVPPPPGRHWAWVHAELDRFDEEGRIEWSSTNNPRLIRYADEKDGDLVQDLWTMKDPQEDGYPTEKPECLLDRIVRTTTNPGDIVLDCFLGSGTTAIVAQRLGRRWIGCDINKGSVQTSAKRIDALMREQAKAMSVPSMAPLPELNVTASAAFAAQLCFCVYQINDYDLAVQHNEAVNLACEFIGIQRTRTDSFFDGTLGSSLVKIIPFGHPLSVLDLEELKRELDARPDEARSITVVCLGTELAAKAWIAEWNVVRSGKSSDHVNRSDVNAIRVIELRSDPKYGGFLKHEPGRARVSVSRVVGTDGSQLIVVEIQDFISPTIVKRLEQQAGLLKPQIDDWRAMVDAVMIDIAYDGQVFNVALADVPERKSDLVSGRYELPAPEGETRVAVKIVDMLGEEVLTLLSV